MNRSERIKYGKEVERMNRRFESAYFPKILKALKTKNEAVINQIKRNGLQAARRWLFQDISNTALSNIVREMYRVVGYRHSQRVNAWLNKEPKQKGFTEAMEFKRLGNNPEWIWFIQDYLNRFLLEKITFRVNSTTRQALISVLDDAIANGWGESEIVKRLNDLPFTRFQAARIARTEVGRAAEVGTAAASETFPFEQNKEWISIKDNRTRGNPQNGQEDHADHYRMDGQVVDADGYFIDPRNGHRLKFPKDPESEAEDSINCRCTHAVVAKRNADGRMIRKPTMSLYTQSVAV